MGNLIEDLCAGAPVVTDGAWGTQLQAQGLPPGECPELCNLNHPDVVEGVALAYVEAGSQVILTNTFGANRLSLARYGLAQHVEAINRAGVRISRRAAKHRARVFGSIGPTGRLLPMAEVTEEALDVAFREQALALAEAGAEALVVETMADLTEAAIAVRAARATGLPVVGCMAYGAGKNGDRTIMGVTPEQAVEELVAAGADAVGANCGDSPAALLGVCRRLRAATRLPVWIKPNAGHPELLSGRVYYALHTAPDEFAAQALELVKAGADYVGGCCGTGPSCIQALARALRVPVAA